jgi:thiosulfate dehydrogenase (quinone) large subunit
MRAGTAVKLSDVNLSIADRLSAVDRRSRELIIGLCRIGVGLLWLANIHWKVPTDFGEANGGGLYKYSESVTRNSPFAPFTWFTREILLPNFQFFGWFTLVSEVVLAGLLLVGFRTKLVALGGAAMTIPIMLTVLYYDRADEWSWSYLLMIIAHLLLFASDAGRYVGLDGLRGKGADALKGALRWIGAVTAVVGAAGLFVSRSMSFAGSKVALLGSDAGFPKEGGGVTRRWELKFMWFNPLWAILMILFGVLILVGAWNRWGARVGALGLAAIAAVIMIIGKFDYARDDGAFQKVATGSNAAVWGGLALAAILIDWRLGRTGHSENETELARATADETFATARPS